MEAALALRQRLADVRSLAFALTWAAYLHNLRGEFDTALGRAESAIEIAAKHRLSGWLAEATIGRGVALVGLGQQREGIAELQIGLAGWNAPGAHLLRQWLGWIAEAHLRAGHLDDALTALDRAAEASGETGSHYQAELHRLRGVVLAQAGEQTEAGSWLRRAIQTAQSQQAKSLELRAATTLARLWRDRGKHAEAHALLAPVHGWFAEGFDTADLKDAKALLEELR